MNFITEEGFSIHTFELSRKLESFREYQNLRQRLFLRVGTFEDKEHDCVICNALRDEGVNLIILYKNAPYVPYLRIRVNAKKIVQPRAAAYKIFVKTGMAHEILIRNLSEIISKFNPIWTIDSFLLSRIDFCVNLSLKNQNMVDLYMKLIQKSSIPAAYRREKFDNSLPDAEYRNKISWRISCQDRSITFYDKMSQLFLAERLSDFTGEILPALLRIEVSFKRNRIVEYARHLECDFLKTSELIPTLVESSRDVIRDAVTMIFPQGAYFNRKIGHRIIRYSPCQKKTRERMHLLFSAAVRRTTLDNAIQRICKEERIGPLDMKYLLRCFEHLSMQPMPVQCKPPVKAIASLNALLGFAPDEFEKTAALLEQYDFT